MRLPVVFLPQLVRHRTASVDLIPVTNNSLAVPGFSPTGKTTTTSANADREWRESPYNSGEVKRIARCCPLRLLPVISYERLIYRHCVYVVT